MCSVSDTNKKEVAQKGKRENCWQLLRRFRYQLEYFSRLIYVTVQSKRGEQLFSTPFRLLHNLHRKVPEPVRYWNKNYLSSGGLKTESVR